MYVQSSTVSIEDFHLWTSVVSSRLGGNPLNQGIASRAPMEMGRQSVVPKGRRRQIPTTGSWHQIDIDLWPQSVQPHFHPLWCRWQPAWGIPMQACITRLALVLHP
jgi:hypothetical protein